MRQYMKQISTPEEFVRVFNAAKTITEAARKLGHASRGACSGKATRLRNLGHPVKRFLQMRPAVDAVTFINVWNSSGSRHEVAERLDMNPNYVHVKVYELRKAGYALKYFCFANAHKRKARRR